MSRTTVAHTQRVINVGTGEQRLFLLGANGLRAGTIYDSATGLYLPAHLREPERIQLARYTRAFNSWTLDGMTVPTTDDPAPDESATADVLHETSGGTSHRVYATSTANLVSGTTYICSLFIEPLNREWCALNVTGGGSAYAWFRLTGQGVLGSRGVSLAAHGIMRFSGDVYRIWIAYTESFTAARPLYVLAATGDTNLTYSGGDQDSLRVWGAQIEAGLYPSSHIINDGTSSVTRTADSASTWDLGATLLNRQPFSIIRPIQIPSHTPAADLLLFQCYDTSGAATDYVKVYAESGTGKLKVTSAATGGSAGSVVVNKVVTDGATHWIGLAMGQGRLVAMADDQAAEDSDATMSAGLDTWSDEASGGWLGQLGMFRSFRPSLGRMRELAAQLIAA